LNPTEKWLGEGATLTFIGNIMIIHPEDLSDFDIKILLYSFDRDCRCILSDFQMQLVLLLLMEAEERDIRHCYFQD